MNLQLKRIYEAPSPTDGKRVLVDRLWPRGISKDRANLDLWLKDIAPSTELRKWFDHDPAKWSAFQVRYRAELAENPVVDQLRSLCKQGQVTLLFAAKDVDHNEAVVIRQFLID